VKKGQRQSQQAQARTSAQQLRYSTIAQAVALALVATSGLAQAQQAADPAKLEGVVVTGIRRGIEAAISIKKNSDSIVEAISAEDIGKLPDATVADSISRLPGVTAQRDKSTGRAKNVSIRGFNGDFSGGLLNGREQASTGDSRGLELDQFPAELLGSIVVYKTPDAQLVGQGLSGTVDQRTLRPLDFGGRQVGVSLKGISSGRGVEGSETGKGNRFALTYVDQFANRTLGVAAGITRYKDRGAGQQKFNSWGGWAADFDYNGGKVKTPGGFTADTETLDYDRDGAMLTLQFKPNKNFETSLDVFYSKGTTALKKTGLEGAIGGNSAGSYDPDGILRNATIANGVATSGTITNYKGVVRNHLEAGDDKLTSIGWNTKYKFSDWTAVGDLSQSKVTKLSSRYETTAGLPGPKSNPQTDSISWTGFTGSNFTEVLYKTGLNYSDRAVARLTDVNGWGGGPASPQAGYLAQPNIKDTINQLRLSANRGIEFWDFNKVDIGFNVTDRKKNKETLEGRLVLKGGDPYAAVVVPGSGVEIAGTTGLPVVSWDPRGSLGTIYDVAAKVDPDILNKDWTVKEKVSTAYAMGDLAGKVGGVDYRGNFGVQLQSTKQSSTGYNVNKQTCSGNTAATCPSAVNSGGATFTDVLPSLNLGFDVAKDQVMRFGLGKVIARPNMADMRASRSVDFDTGKNPITQTAGYYKGDAGAPNLKPFKATAFDLSYERYFGNKGYFSVAGFAKSLDSYILKVGTPFDFTPLISGPAKADPTQGVLTKPINGTGGKISGIEVSVNLPFSLLTPSLDGFGFFVSYSNTNSKLDLASAGFNTQDVSGKSIPLPGLSRKVTNGKIYYEKNGVQLGVAVRDRSDFLGEISDFQDNKQYTFIKAEAIVDVQAGYELQSGPLKGLAVQFTGQNMTKARFERFNGDRDSVTESIRPGKTYALGVSYKF
jgi:iron complex outermembrane recepter protein